MFSFFTKKYHIADYLHGLTDFHCHLLPEIDDGAQSPEVSLEMIGEYKSLGYKGVIATPHIMEDFYSNNTAIILAKLDEFQNFLSESGFTDFSVKAAAEYMMDKQFDSLVLKKDLLPLVGKKVLVEMSYLQKMIYTDSQLFELKQQGFTPILAHPERYVYLKDRTEVLDFKKKGCYLQLNLLSLSQHYGSQVQHKALDLLCNGHYDIMGTDAHNPRHLKAIKQITLTKKQLPFFEALVEKTRNFC